MSNIDDKLIINWIKKQEFSKLTFLDYCWQSHENGWYLGFYYFIQYLKQECLDDVMAEVTSRHIRCISGQRLIQIFFSRLSSSSLSIKATQKSVGEFVGNFVTISTFCFCIFVLRYRLVKRITVSQNFYFLAFRHERLLLCRETNQRSTNR